MMKIRFQHKIRNISKGRSKLISVYIFVLICLIFTPLKSQILQDSTAIRIIEEGIGNIYNLKFREAEMVYNSISHSYPGHPVLHLYKGMMIYWENFPIFSTSPARRSFEAEMRKCIEISDKDNYPAPDYEPEYLLANICARGLLLLFYADNDLSGEVFPLAKSTYRPLMRSFRFTSSCSDFYYFTGIYNYYRDAYPRVYPVYKTVAFLFPPGDSELGIRQIEISAKKSIALRAESDFILSWIRMNFESNFEAALPYCKRLNDHYQSNPLYKACYIKNLLLLKRYDEAEKIIGISGEADKSSFYQAVLKIFNGLIQEKKYHNYLLAREYFSKGIIDLSAFSTYGNEFAGYGYLGLSRLEEGEEDNHERRLNRRKAMDLLDFKKITFDE